MINKDGGGGDSIGDGSVGTNGSSDSNFRDDKTKLVAVVIQLVMMVSYTYMVRIFKVFYYFLNHIFYLFYSQEFIQE